MDVRTVLALDVGTTAVKAALVSVQIVAAADSATDTRTRTVGAPALHVIAQASVVTDAYLPAHALQSGYGCAAESGVRSGPLQEQAISCILRALDAAVTSLPGDALPCVDAIVLADQMHGSMLWHHAHACAPSTLVTWEDGRTDAHALQTYNERVRAADAGASAVHNGFGVATLAWQLQHGALESPSAAGEHVCMRRRALQPRHASCAATAVSHATVECAAQWDCAGTIGAYITALLSGSRHSVMHTTDAASWGAFDVARGTWSLPAIASIDPRIVDWLPARLVQSVQPVGMLQLHAMDAAFPRWAALLRGAATDAAASSATSPPTRRSPPALAAHVYCSIGDHAAAVFGTLCVSARPQGEVPLTGTQPVSILPLARLSQTWQQVLVVTLGTSAQVATVARAPLPGAPTPDGVDVRPFLTRAARVCADAEGWALHVAAAMNGGNVLAHVADAAVTAGVAPTRAAAYAYLEAAAHEELERRPADAIVRIVAAAAGSEVRFGSVGGSVGGSVCEDSCASAAAHGALTPCATSLLPPQGMRINSSQLLFVGTRCTRLPFRERNAAGGDCDVKHSSEPAPSTHEQLSPEQLGSVRAVAQSLGLCFHSCSVADDDVERAAAHSTEDDTTRKLWARAYVAAAGAMLWNTCALLPSTYWRTCEHVIAAGAAFDKSATLRALLRALLSAECVRWLMAEPGTADRASPSLIWAPPEYVATAGAIGPLAAVLACAEVPGVGA